MITRRGIIIYVNTQITKDAFQQEVSIYKRQLKRNLLKAKSVKSIHTNATKVKKDELLFEVSDDRHFASYIFFSHHINKLRSFTCKFMKTKLSLES